MQHTIMNPPQQLPEGFVFTIKQHANPPAAAVVAEQQQSLNQAAYLANIDFVAWPPFCYIGQTQPAAQLFSYFQNVRVWLDQRSFISFHSDFGLAFDGLSVGGFAVPIHCFYWKQYEGGAFQ